jgi:hypothetical protein
MEARMGDPAPAVIARIDQRQAEARGEADAAVAFWSEAVSGGLPDDVARLLLFNHMRVSPRLIAAIAGVPADELPTEDDDDD